MFIFTGCARSGTPYIAELLERSNFDIGNEVFVGSSGISSWMLTSKSSIEPHNGPIPSSMWTGTERRIHLVRDPIACINSIQTLTCWEYIDKELGFDKDQHLLLKSMLFWARWNKMAEYEKMIKIEDFDYDAYVELCEYINIAPNKEAFDEIPTFDSNEPNPHSCYDAETMRRWYPQAFDEICITAYKLGIEVK